MGTKTLNHFIEHTLLRSDATATDVRNALETAIQNQVFGLCIHPYWIQDCVHWKGQIAGAANLKIVSVIGFPTGSSLTEAKVAEAIAAKAAGADELDMVINLGAFKSGRLEAVVSDIRAVVEAVRPIPIKVILETSLLNLQQIAEASLLVVNGGGHFVKTSTGMQGAGATPEQIRTIFSAIGSKARIKASGGIRDRRQAELLIAEGAHRLGTSSTVQILSGESHAHSGNY